MKILGIESSCDETAASVVEDGTRLISSVINSQIDIHAHYGGVIPEVAARSHIEAVNPVINEALSRAGCNWDDIDAIAVTYAPGLIGSLLVGTLAARALAILKNKPLYPIHHVEAHVYANFITSQKNSDLKLPSSTPKFPILALIVSGGHTQLVLFKDHGDYQLLGQTRDDAIGEAFDKVAKILGLPYPGGPSVSRMALEGDPYKYDLPIAKLSCKGNCKNTGLNPSEPLQACNHFDFSFSGLKTAVLRAVQREVGKDYSFPSHELSALLTASQKADFAASFQRVAVKTVVDKTIKAYTEYSPASVVIAGGVAANQELRKVLKSSLPIDIEYAPLALCGDNGAMIASLAYFRSQTSEASDPYSLEVFPSLSMTDSRKSPN